MQKREKALMQKREVRSVRGIDQITRSSHVTTDQDAIEVVERCVMQLLDSAMLSTVGADAAGSQEVSDRHNVATAANIDTPRSSSFVNSTEPQQKFTRR
jgi:hypothetical protein